MTGIEKNAMAFGYYVDRHIDDERKLNFRALIDKASKDPEKLKDIRGQLAPTLRDTIVGYNYIHYAPPGAQILMTNPLFVRGHDFIGMQGRTTAGDHGDVRHGLAFERRRKAGGFALGPALRAGRGGAEFSGAHANPGADLGRSGAADDAGGEGAAFLERDAGADALGGDEHALYGIGSGRGFGESGEAGAGVSGGGQRGKPWRASLIRRAITAGDAHEALEPADSFGDVFDGAKSAGHAGYGTGGARDYALSIHCGRTGKREGDLEGVGHAEADAVEFVQPELLNLEHSPR